MKIIKMSKKKIILFAIICLVLVGFIGWIKSWNYYVDKSTKKPQGKILYIKYDKGKNKCLYSINANRTNNKKIINIDSIKGQWNRAIWYNKGESIRYIMWNYDEKNEELYEISKTGKSKLIKTRYLYAKNAFYEPTNINLFIENGDVYKLINGKKSMILDYKGEIDNKFATYGYVSIVKSPDGELFATVRYGDNRANIMTVLWHMFGFRRTPALIFDMEGKLAGVIDENAESVEDWCIDD